MRNGKGTFNGLPVTRCYIETLHWRQDDQFYEITKINDNTRTSSEYFMEGIITSDYITQIRHTKVINQCNYITIGLFSLYKKIAILF